MKENQKEKNNKRKKSLTCKVLQKIMSKPNLQSPSQDHA